MHWHSVQLFSRKQSSTISPKGLLHTSLTGLGVRLESGEDEMPEMLSQLMKAERRSNEQQLTSKVAAAGSRGHLLRVEIKISRRKRTSPLLLLLQQLVPQLLNVALQLGVLHHEFLLLSDAGLGHCRRETPLGSKLHTTEKLFN